jgi:hypothetical protein
VCPYEIKKYYGEKSVCCTRYFIPNLICLFTSLIARLALVIKTQLLLKLLNVDSVVKNEYDWIV